MKYEQSGLCAHCPGEVQWFSIGEAGVRLWCNLCGSGVHKNLECVRVSQEKEPSFTEKTLEEFREQVKELDNPYFLDNADGDTALFGYKTERDTYIWTVVDWGNIEKWLSTKLSEAYKEGQKHAS